MKRFFCTVCGYVKRVQQYPSDISSPNSDNVLMRTGTCARHHIQSDRPVLISQKLSTLKASIQSQTKKRA